MKKRSKTVLTILFLFFISIVVSFWKNQETFNQRKVEASYQAMGYNICQDDFSCPIEHLARCEKSYFKIYAGANWIEEMTYKENGQCVFYLIKSDDQGMICYFNEAIMDLQLAKRVKLYNIHKDEQIQKHCQLITKGEVN